MVSDTECLLRCREYRNGDITIVFCLENTCRHFFWPYVVSKWSTAFWSRFTHDAHNSGFPKSRHVNFADAQTPSFSGPG